TDEDARDHTAGDRPAEGEQVAGVGLRPCRHVTTPSPLSAGLPVSFPRPTTWPRAVCEPADQVVFSGRRERITPFGRTSRRVGRGNAAPIPGVSTAHGTLGCAAQVPVHAPVATRRPRREESVGMKPEIHPQYVVTTVTC